MAHLTIEVPDDLALRLEAVKDRIIDILRLGYQNIIGEKNIEFHDEVSASASTDNNNVFIFDNSTVEHTPRRTQDDGLTDEVDDRGLVEKINAACLHIETGLPDDMANISRRRLLEVDW